MRPNKFALLLALIGALIAYSSIPCLAVGVKFKTSGIYVDSSSGQHAWSINDAHTLLWDGEPYIPVGGAFASRYIALGPTEENYAADVEALETIKSKGITDILLKSTGPITSTEPANWQRIIDYLDANGFTYGIEMDDGPKQPLAGYIIAPNLYRLQGPTSDTTIVCDWPGVDSAIYVVGRAFDKSIQTTGGAIVKGGKVSITLPETLRADQTLIVYPRRTFKSVSEGGMGDLWTGFGEYRDRVLAFFKGVKFGPGLRFFLEPFTSKMDFTGDMASFMPDSTGFRLGFEAHLTRKYTHQGSVNSAWGLNENLDSIETAARIMPMWNSGRGVPYAYDRASAKMYPIDVTVTRTWRDIIDYRDTSAQQFMNTISDTLRKQVANVPVIFKSAKYHRVYANPFGMSGFDGLGAVAYGTGDVPVTSAAGGVYSLAEESGKTTWYIAAATQTTADNKLLVGYPTEAAMTSALDYLREVGCKGFFIDSLQALPDDTRGNFSLLNAPEQLDWLNSFKDKVHQPAQAEFKPEVVYYPVAPATGAHVKRLMRNTWWLPTLRIGRTTFVGDGLSAYSILGENRSVLWSNVGERTITLKVADARLFPSIDFPADARLDKKKRGMFTISLSDVPTVLRGMPFELVFPYETAETQIAKLSELIPEADRAGLDVKTARESMDSAKTVLKNGLPLTAYGIAQTSSHDLLRLMGSDVWLEGEESPAQNFGGATAAQGASGGMALILNTPDEAPLAPYSVAFRLSADANSSYEVWIAGTPPTDGSPMNYSLDDMGRTPVAADGKIENYAPGLAWYKAGTLNLYPGNHVLKFEVDGRRSQDNRYYFAIDAIVLSPRGFTPNGVQKPF